MNANDSKLSLNQRNAIMQNTAWSASNKAIAMQKLASRFDLSMRQARHIVNYQDGPNRGIVTILERKLEQSEPLALSAVSSYRQNVERGFRLDLSMEERRECNYDCEEFREPREITLWHFGKDRFIALNDDYGLIAVCIVCPKNTALFVENVPYALWITLFHRANALKGKVNV